MTDSLSYGEKGAALLRAARYRPRFTAVAILFSVVAAGLEGIGLGFILPIVELAQGDIDPTEASGILGAFADVYLALGVPFSLGYLVVGVATVMTVRYTLSFLVGWLRGAIETQYTSFLQKQAFERAMLTETAYFDRAGSDNILNAIVTQAEHAGRTLRRIVRTFEQGLLSLMYFGIAMYLAPAVTVAAAVVFGLLTYAVQNSLESGYSLGDRFAAANEDIQENAQAGTQGIRDVKLFGLQAELRDRFDAAVDRFVDARTRYFRNKAAIDNFYQLVTAIGIFVFVYVMLTYASLSLSGLGVYLFAMFRLGPRVSTLNNLAYQVDADLPHLVRTQRFVDELDDHSEVTGTGRSVPAAIDTVAFEDVSFAYDTADETVLDDVSFAVDREEFVAFVGPSGAGKSTIVSLLARLYQPDSGIVTANGVDIDEFEIGEWRSSVSVVRQDPHIFNDTLRRNVTVGNRDAGRDEIERVCELARVTEFLDDLSNGYETRLGDDGVRLSGGQRQRVAIARALLKESDLLVFDEATSDLDTTLEAQVHRNIESWEQDCALIVVAHRLSTVVDADRIYTMEDGAITEVGDHEELVGNDGTYARLYATQTQDR